MPTLAYFVAALFLTPASLVFPIAAQLEETVPEEVEVEEPSPPAEGVPSESAPSEPPETPQPPAPAPSTAEPPREHAPHTITRESLVRVPIADAPPRQPTPEEILLAAQLRQRANVSDVHRGFGIATWVTMAATLALGGIQLHDDYGPFASTEADTPCAQGRAIMQDFCGDAIPWPHMMGGILTSTLYLITSGLSLFFMPDPLRIEDSPTPAGERLRAHKVLRWFHWFMLLATSTLGTVTANLPPAEFDFETRQALAWSHMAAGLTTFVLLSIAGGIMIF